MLSIKDYVDYSYDVLSKNVVTEASTAYRAMRLMQTNAVALASQLHDQKKLCETKLKDANSIDELESFSAWLDRQEARVQRKINGKEIKNKSALQKFINLYHEYRGKMNAKKSQLER